MLDLYVRRAAVSRILLPPSSGYMKEFILRSAGSSVQTLTVSDAKRQPLHLTAILVPKLMSSSFYCVRTDVQNLRQRDHCNTVVFQHVVTLYL